MATVKDFIQHLRIMSGTGNGIGENTVKRLEQIAIKEGFIKQPKALK